MADEGDHVHLVGPADRFVDPEPGAHAAVIGACREVRNMESLELAGGAVVDDGEDDEVAGEDGFCVAFVGDCEGAARNVSAAGGMHV